MEQDSKYWPVVRGGEPGQRFRFGNYIATLLTDLESPGKIDYLYVMCVFEAPDDELCLCIASEKNARYEPGTAGDDAGDRGESHFLGLFPGQGHVNMGSSNDWADLEKFTVRALEAARQHLGVEHEPVEELFE